MKSTTNMAIVTTSSTPKPSLREIICSPSYFEILHARISRDADPGADRDAARLCWLEAGSRISYLQPQKLIHFSPLNGSHLHLNNALTSKRAKPAQSRQDTFFPAS